MFKKILIALGLVVLLFVVVGLFLPKNFTVTRSVKVKSSKTEIHALCSDLKRWPEWTPWRDMDPTMKETPGNITAGVGASQSWQGESEGGRLTMTKSDPNEGIAYDMVFIHGQDESPAKSVMTYTQNGDAVDVDWRIEGAMDVPVIGGYLALLSDRMIGPAFETGLAKLRERAEAQRTPPPAVPAPK